MTQKYQTNKCQHIRSTR